MKYSPDGGRITLSAREQGGEVHVLVADTGRGILAEDLPHVFEKFYRGRAPALQPGGQLCDLTDEVVEAPGVGLGLYLARTIIEEIGGHISVESAAGRGSTFTLSLPPWEDQENGASSREAY